MESHMFRADEGTCYGEIAVRDLSRSFLCFTLFGATLFVGCSNTAPSRAQLVVVVDTDAPVHSQLFDHPELSADAAIDTLRVDAISATGVAKTYDLRSFLGPSKEDWPISFGVPTGGAEGGGPIWLRLRAFRGDLATPGEVNGVATLDPLPEITIDRLVDLDPPSEGIVRVRVTLREDCLGVGSSFGATPSTCVDGAHLRASPRDGVELVDETDAIGSLAGTWPRASEVPCRGDAPEGTVCVPGGFSILGDPAFLGLGDGVTQYDSVPLRPVLVSPFFMDETEVTVEALQRLFTEGLVADEPVKQGDPLLPNSEFCTWPGKGSSGSEKLPVNCITYAMAKAACEARGGTLPSEAEWEHAARGRGQARLFPWGNTDASCCSTSAARPGDPTLPAQCPGPGIEAAGSHPLSPACDGLGDVSRDGVMDLGGSVAEVLRDWFQPLDADCWKKVGGGILEDPVCVQDEMTISWSSRGGNWNGGLAATASPFRYAFSPQDPTSGFRCVFSARGGS
jgi:formylglycine-generating enzyme required for sulfatase activity